jgi:hypothetical protein
VVCWVSARIDVDSADLEAETRFWSEVVDADLPPYLEVRATRRPSRVQLRVHRSTAPVASTPASFPGVRRSRVYQVSLDVPGPRFELEAQTWVDRTGGRVEVLERRPEFAWLRIPGGPRPLDVLLQRLDRTDGPTAAHLDVGTSDREAEVRRHLALGATLLAEEEFWTVLADPAALPYCVTDRDPATGVLV